MYCNVLYCTVLHLSVYWTRSSTRPRFLSSDDLLAVLLRWPGSEPQRMMLPLKLREHQIVKVLRGLVKHRLQVWHSLIPDQFEGGQFPDKLRDLSEEVVVQQDHLQTVPCTVLYCTVMYFPPR